MFSIGMRVVPTEDFHRQFPKSKARTGIIKNRSRADPSVWMVQWNERPSREPLHEKFLQRELNK